MKKVIELLEDGLAYIRGGETADYESDAPTVLACLNAIKTQIKKAIAELETPRWHTPEQWEAETGKPWPDDWLVYCLVEESHCRFPPNAAWVFGTHQWAKNWYPYCPVVCATEAGKPPDGWRPEENNAAE